MADLLFKLLPVLLAQLLFFVTTNSQSLNQVLNQSFVIQERPGRLHFSTKRQMEHMGGWAVWFRESPIGSNLVTENLRKIKCVTKVCIIRK